MPYNYHLRMASASEIAPRLQTAPSRQQRLAIAPTILLADDQREIREAVNAILSAEFKVIGTAEDGRHAVELATNLQPDILVLDISMPVVNGLEAASQIKDKTSHIRIVFLTVHSDPEFVEAALATGALGYVLKAFVAAELIPAIWAALHGEIFISKGIDLP